MDFNRKLILWTLPVAVLLRLQNDFGTMLVSLPLPEGCTGCRNYLENFSTGFSAIAVIGGTALTLVISTGGGRYWNR